MHVRPFEIEDQPKVIALWHESGVSRPSNDPAKDIPRKLALQRHMFLVGEVDGEIVGSVMAGYDGHRGWIYYLAVAPRVQREGYGRALMEQAEHLLRQAGCPKINILVRTGNEDVIEFYRRVGYTLDDVVSLGKRLEPDQLSS